MQLIEDNAVANSETCLDTQAHLLACVYTTLDGNNTIG